MNKWPHRYLELAEHVSRWSKDHSTKVGAALVSPDGGTVTPGYNGFPRGIEDDPARLMDRGTKLAMTLHAEENAILNLPVRPAGYSLYVWPMPPCSHCAAVVIQAGITRVVAPTPGERWRESCELGRAMMLEAGLEVEWVITSKKGASPEPTNSTTFRSSSRQNCQPSIALTASATSSSSVIATQSIPAPSRLNTAPTSGPLLLAQLA